MENLFSLQYHLTTCPNKVSESVDKMITPDEALKLILSSDITLEKEKIPIVEATDRILAEDILSKTDIPPFDNSAMDGYAINSVDDSLIFEVIETIPAGHVPVKKLQKGTCSKIMTGAMMPEGANKVIPVELALENDRFVRFNEGSIVSHVRHKGEDLKPGDRVIEAGSLIRPQEVANICKCGYSKVCVYKYPRVGVITTGTELIEPGDELQPGKIFNSNSYQLFSQITRLRAMCKCYGTVKDDKPLTIEMIGRALEENDILIISGGVSMGDFDYVPVALKELSVQLLFDKVAIKPGKPTVFGKKGNKYIFGLPGNPVSTFVIFEIFVKPFIYKMSGHNYKPILFKGVMNANYQRKKTERFEYIPVEFDGQYVIPAKYHGSGHLIALSRTNALIKIYQGVSEIEKGTIVDVRLI